MIGLLLQWLAVTAFVALLFSFAMASLLIVVEARDMWRSHRAQRRDPIPKPRCACDSWVLWWDDAPLYHDGFLHEEHRCYPDMEAAG